MNNSGKEQIGCDVICRSHSARTERDLYRICPSKLSKRELEDLYFALLENNLDLKKTINIQQDKIKVLSTRVQRISTVQKNVAGKEKDCCASKAAINEHKESISDLKKTNERMGERIRVLNMRLCSAKQFLKRSPSQATNANKASSRGSFKNSSMSALIAKPSDSNTRTTAVSCQFLDKDGTPRTTRTVETETKKSERVDSEKPCDENKCRTMMDELKEKIVNLQEELSTSHKEYSERIAKLESQVSELHDENLRVRSEHVASEHALQQRAKRADRLQDKLRTADAKCNELNMELSIEKRRVTELETGLKLANMSNHVVKTIEQLAATKEEKREPLLELRRDGSSTCSYCSQKTEERKSASKTEKPNIQVTLEVPSTRKTKDEVKFSQSDDSGCTDLNKSCETEDDQVMVKMNKDLMKKIAELQTQLDLLRVSAAGEAVTSKQNIPKEFESYDVETREVDETQNGNAGDIGSMIMAAEPTLEKSNSENVAERDKDTKSRVNDDEEATVSKPWEDYLITGRSENLEDSLDIVKSDQKSDSSTTIKNKSDSKIDREDESRYQIPGPIPVVSQSSSKEKKKVYRNNQNSKDSCNERFKSKKGNYEEKTVKIFENSKESYFCSDNKIKINDSVAEGEIKASPDTANLKDVEAKSVDKKLKNVSVIDVEAKLGPTPTRDSILVNRKKMASSPSQFDEADEDEPTMAEVKKESTSSFVLKMGSTCTPPRSEVNEKIYEQATTVEQNVDMYELCESRATICRCPVLERRDVAVFRSCSGTLRFRTTAANDKLRRCGCQVLTNSSGTQVDPPTSPKRRDSATYTANAANTYTIPVDKCSRSTSPDNTEHEISSLTDLPSEKEAKSPRFEIPGGLSPGEEKATMTYTDTETHTDCYGSLSEGEMPTGKVRNASIGEMSRRTPKPLATETMEATLLSISEELARCRQLLLSQRPREKDVTQCTKVPSREELAVHALHHSAANRRIADTHAPSCVFTLHIGTLVLSDEAVLFSHGKSLYLTWKYYSQSATMTHVHTGRVVTFDFVTEYDVSFNEEFLDYMKHADMSIVLCELNKENEPFAVCSLPLREALLHANRRADMSLALVPNLPHAGGRDSVGEEIGILDLWCSLRVDESLLPIIHHAMHTPSPTNWPGTNPLQNDSKPNPLDVDDASIERNSREDKLSPSPGKSTASDVSPRKISPASQDEDITSIIAGDKSSRYYDEVQQYRNYKPYRRRSSQTQKSIPASDLGHKGQVGFENRWPTMRQESSGIIINEVPANIKSTQDMKQALERNVQQNNNLKLPKMDDDASHTHSSIGSVKSLAARHQLSKLRWPKNKSSRDRVDSLQELLKKDKGSSIGGSSKFPVGSSEYMKDNSDPTLSKGNNISKYLGLPGLNKLVEASKKSVKYTDSISREEPQKENSADSDENSTQSIDITILWLALNEECEAMVNPNIQRLYVAYSFLGRRGADLETPFSLPKPKHYADKCYFNFKKTFHLHECDLPLLGHMSRCQAGGGASTDPRDCLVFTVISEPPEDPLGLSSCEDIGYAHLYLGDVLAYSGGSGGYTEVVGVRGARGGVCGVLAVRVDNLSVLRSCLSLSHSHRDLPRPPPARCDAPPHSSMIPTFEID